MQLIKPWCIPISPDYVRNNHHCHSEQKKPKLIKMKRFRLQLTGILTPRSQKIKFILIRRNSKKSIKVPGYGWPIRWADRPYRVGFKHQNHKSHIYFEGHGCGCVRAYLLFAAQRHNRAFSIMLINIGEMGRSVTAATKIQIWVVYSHAQFLSVGIPM